MSRGAAWAVGVLAACALGLSAWQHTRISELEAGLAAAVIDRSGGDRAAPSPDLVREAASRAVAAAGSGSERARAIAALEARVAALEARPSPRLGQGRPRPEPAHRPARPTLVQEDGAGEDVDDEVGSLREDVDALLTGAGVDTDEGRKLVKDLIEDAREEARATRRKQWSDLRRQADEQWLAEFSAGHGLDAATTARVSELISSRRAAGAEIFGKVREGELTFAEAKVQAEELRAATDVSLLEVLGDERFQALKDDQEAQGDAIRGLWR